MKIVIDRIENGVIAAELSDGRIVQLPAPLFPHAVEGDVYTIEKDISETETRRRRIEEKLNKLFLN